MHVAVYPYLNSLGVPDDPSQYDYVKVRTASGTITYLGMPWINESSITVVNSVVLVVTIDNVSSSDVTNVRNALVQNGFNSITIATQVPSQVGP
jgi:hypothetical protein